MGEEWKVEGWFGRRGVIVCLGRICCDWSGNEVKWQWLHFGEESTLILRRIHVLGI